MVHEKLILTYQFGNTDADDFMFLEFHTFSLQYV